MMRHVLGSRASIGGVLGSGRGGAAAWYLAGGTIAAGDVAEWVEIPTIGQLYAGGTLTGAWTIAVRTAQNPTGNSYVFDSLNGRIILGISGGNNGFFAAGTWTGPLFDLSGTVATYFLVSNGSSVQAYKDNSAVGSAVSASEDIGGTTRWRNDQANSFWPWEVDVPRAAIYKIALDSTQRAALYSSMAA